MAATAIDPRLAEAKDESTPLRPMTIIDTENATIPTIGVVIATPAAPKKRNAEVLRPRRKSEAGVIASLRVVTIRPRRDGIGIATAIVTTTNLRLLPREISKKKKDDSSQQLKTTSGGGDYSDYASDKDVAKENLSQSPPSPN